MKRLKRMHVILGIIILIFSFVMFVIPCPKTEIFWLSYIFSIMSLLVQWKISIIAMTRGKTVKSKFYGWPIMRVGLYYMLMTLICAVLFISLSCTALFVPVWIPAICYIVLCGFAAIGFISLDSVRNFVEQEDMKLTAQTDFMKKLYSEAYALSKSVSDDAMKKVLSKMADEIRYSDPVSRPDLKLLEGHIYETFETICESAQIKDSEKVCVACEQFHQQLMMRNSMCKVGKN